MRPTFQLQLSNWWSENPGDLPVFDAAAYYDAEQKSFIVSFSLFGLGVDLAIGWAR